MNLVRQLGCLQLDPISVVARSHLLVLWSRLGPFDPNDLSGLLWRDRSLFEYWAHSASIVLTEDFPIHSMLMRRHLRGQTGWERNARAWLDENRALSRYILRELRRRGPLRLQDFEDRSPAGWQSTGWTAGRNVNRMLEFLWARGKVLVAGREGLQKLWDLAERCLPEWTPREQLTPREVVRRATQRAIRALGVARPGDIPHYFTRGRYPGLPAVLDDLQREELIVPVVIREDGRTSPERWFVHRDDIALLEGLDEGEWNPRTTLLSPFDNLICHRARTERLFDFSYRMEIYVPKSKRRYGYYTMPILHGERLIGRLDPSMDRKRGRLAVNSVHLEASTRPTKTTRRAIEGAVENLAAFLHANEIEYSDTMPSPWRST